MYYFESSWKLLSSDSENVNLNANQYAFYGKVITILTVLAFDIRIIRFVSIQALRQNAKGIPMYWFVEKNMLSLSSEFESANKARRIFF